MVHLPDKQVVLRWCRFRLNKKTGVREVREGNQCWGCNTTCTFEFAGVEALELRKMRQSNPELDQAGELWLF